MNDLQVSHLLDEGYSHDHIVNYGQCGRDQVERVAWNKSIMLVFGNEWADLDTPAKRAIREDFREAIENDEVEDLHELRRNIGTGNLASYARCMLIK